MLLHTTISYKRIVEYNRYVYKSNKNNGSYQTTVKQFSNFYITQSERHEFCRQQRLGFHIIPVRMQSIRSDDKAPIHRPINAAESE